MIKADVIEFFDRLAPDWDARMLRDDQIIGRILDNAGVKTGVRVLDVGCGTGVLFPDYLGREVNHITGIDISAVMTGIATKKFGKNPKIDIVTGDAETILLEDTFDSIVIYNAFPHFPDQEKLIRHLSALLAPGGILTVAHGMSRDKIDCHHTGTASKVSIGLMSAHKLSEMFSRYLDVCAVISDDEMYQVAGKKRINEL